MAGGSLLDVVAKCDNWPADGKGYAVFYVNGTPLGHVVEAVHALLLRDYAADFATETVDGRRRLHLASDGGREVAFDQATTRLNAIAQELRAEDAFEVLRGWRGEQYTIYGHGSTPLFTLERAACALFGVVTYGAHLNVYLKNKDGSLSVWCPRRAPDKATYPGMLDNSVAGGISDGLSPYETIVKEAWEEASIPEALARRCIRPAGCISYIHKTDDGWIQPEVQYIYDMLLDGDDTTFTPKPNDGESEQFELLSMAEIQHQMHANKFKPNCAAVLVDFMLRHGTIATEHSDYVRLTQRLHRTFELPTR